MFSQYHILVRKKISGERTQILYTLYCTYCRVALVAVVEVHLHSHMALANTGNHSNCEVPYKGKNTRPSVLQCSVSFSDHQPIRRAPETLHPGSAMICDRRLFFVQVPPASLAIDTRLKLPAS